MKINLISKLLIFSLIFISNNLFNSEESTKPSESVYKFLADRLENIVNQFNEIGDKESFEKLPLEKQSELKARFVNYYSTALIKLAKENLMGKDADYDRLQKIFLEASKRGGIIEKFGI